MSSAGVTLNDVASTGLLQVMHGTSDLATLRFSNATRGAFHATSDSAGGLLITLV